MRLVQADRDRFVLPRKRRMRHDDWHIRKVDSYIVDWHRISVFQTDSATAPHSCPDAAVPGVKDHRKPRLCEHFIERVGDAVVRIELLDRWMKLQPAHGPCSDQAA